MERFFGGRRFERLRLAGYSGKCRTQRDCRHRWPDRHTLAGYQRVVDSVGEKAMRIKSLWLAFEPAQTESALAAESYLLALADTNPAAPGGSCRSTTAFGRHSPPAGHGLGALEGDHWGDRILSKPKRLE